MHRRHTKPVSVPSAMRARLWSILILMLPSITWGGTALGDIAAQMSPGTWAELRTIGLTDSLLRIGAGSLFQYADSAIWDPVSRQALFIGGAHAEPPNNKFITYQDANNSWRQEPSPSWFCQAGESGFCIQHAYDHNAIDPVNGYFYWHTFNTQKVYRYHIPTRSWTTIRDIPTSVSCCLGFAYFPEMGGLIMVGGGEVYFWNASANQWTLLTSALTMGPYHNFAEYNPVHKFVLFGGGNGSRNIYKLDTSGRITALANAPIEVGVAATNIAVDPASGKYIVIDQLSADYYEYDPITNAWRKLSGRAPLLNNNGWVEAVGTPVSTYGVIMFVKYNFDQSTVYLYKHSASPPPIDTIPPAAPTGLRVN